jgi:hypothetical protein
MKKKVVCVKHNAFELEFAVWMKAISSSYNFCLLKGKGIGENH